METAFTTRMGQFVLPDIRVYDTVYRKDVKYVSVILSLKENYLANESDYTELHKRSEEVIYDVLPKESIHGTIRYFYQGQGQTNIRQTSIGNIRYAFY